METFLVNLFQFFKAETFLYSEFVPNFFQAEPFFSRAFFFDKFQEFLETLATSLQTPKSLSLPSY